MNPSGMTRHQFLAELHAILRPRVYLEVGVQTGASLALAEAAGVAIGIDPAPGVLGQFQRPNQNVRSMTADAYFAEEDGWRQSGSSSYNLLQIDFAFIDGSHLFEDALRDYMNIARYLAPRAVVAFDDVLPYNQAIAERIQPPGDWTGDVWKIDSVMRNWGPWPGTVRLVDTYATGTLLVTADQPDAWLRSSERLAERFDEIVGRWATEGDAVPDHVLNRTWALDPVEVLNQLRAERATSA